MGGHDASTCCGAGLREPVSVHAYTPKEALDLLLRKLRAADQHLARQIEDAINAGKDVEETDLNSRRRLSRKKPRVYRRTVPFTEEEALRVALVALRAYFVELPSIANAAAASFETAAVGRRGSTVPWDYREEGTALDMIGVAKVLRIELQPETRISPAERETFSLEPVAEGRIVEQRQNLSKLFELFQFDDH